MEPHPVLCDSCGLSGQRLVRPRDSRLAATQTILPEPADDLEWFNGYREDDSSRE